MRLLSLSASFLGAALLCIAGITPGLAADNESATDRAAQTRGDDTFSQNEVVQKASDFFGVASESVAKAVERVFAKYGKPNAYITGQEAAGAIGVGLRYGDGELYRKVGGPTKIYWQGPSVGFDFGGNASKVFTLIYNLPNTDAIFQRFPGVEGTYYFVAGIGVNYQQADNIVLAPMRTGVGLRAGANIGYLSYSRERNIIPF